jgi:hypothetical protein
MPFPPNMTINPIPCDTEGINIGRSANMLNMLLYRMLARATQNAINKAAVMDTTLAAAETTAEFFAARHNLGELKIEYMSEYVIYAIIRSKGIITVTVRRTMSSVLPVVEILPFMLRWQMFQILYKRV